jgi:hypothetical protein
MQYVRREREHSGPQRLLSIGTQLRQSVSAAASIREQGGTRRRDPSRFRIRRCVAVAYHSARNWEVPAASNPSHPCDSWSADPVMETAPEGTKSASRPSRRGSVHRKRKGTCEAVNLLDFRI